MCVRFRFVARCSGNLRGGLVRVVENPAAASRLIKIARERQDSLNARLDGLHVSDLIHCSIPPWLRLHSDTSLGTEGEIAEEVALIFLSGQALHALLEHGEAENRLVRDMDGVVLNGTVDLMEVEDGLLFPAELKSTRISAAAEIAVKAPHYIEQLATYAVMHGINFGRLYVFHMLGDYTGTKRPQLRAWDVYFEESELDNWTVEMQRRADLIRGGSLPSLAEHKTWECEYCTLWAENGGLCAGGEGERRLFFYQSNVPDVYID